MMNGKNALRWGFISLFAGVGGWLCVVFGRLLFTEGVSGIVDVFLSAIPLGGSAILLHLAYLLYAKRYREFTVVLSWVVALIVAAVLTSLQVSRYGLEAHQAWWEATDRHPLVGIAAFPLGFALLALPFVVAGLAYWGVQSLLLKMFDEPSASRRLLQ